MEKEYPTAKCQLTYPVTSMSNTDTLSCSGKLVTISIDRHCTATNSLTVNSECDSHATFKMLQSSENTASLNFIGTQTSFSAIYSHGNVVLGC